jgi:beta-fructofuranosidase
MSRAFPQAVSQLLKAVLTAVSLDLYKFSRRLFKGIRDWLACRRPLFAGEVYQKMSSCIVTNRREFLLSAGAVALAAIAVGGGSLEAQSHSDLQARLAADPRRPQFHLLPAHNWMNDPNGPIYFNRMYHMFFQYNPLAAVWGDMSWNHAVSPDMLHWSHLPLAMTPTPGSPDGYGCFSGSAIQIAKRVYAVYTGTRESTPDLVTLRDGGKTPIQESQCLAWSDDPKLVRWTKDPEPIVPLPPRGMQVCGFRDPSAWKQGDAYYMTVGSGIENVGGCVLLYRSKDLKTWEYLHPLVSGEWNGKKTANPVDDGSMWECPDFFALDGGHVLIYSTVGKVYWQSGVLNEATMKFTPVKTGLLDLDAFYAPKTQLDAQGRRILWGWIPERRSDEEMREAGWSGLMSLPKVLRLDADGTLRIQMLPQIGKLRSGSLPAEAAPAGLLKTLRQASGEVLCAGTSNHAMQFSISNGATELLRAVYTPEKHAFMVNGKEVSLRPGDEPELHAFVDGSVIELILSQRIGYTVRFYFAGATAPDISVAATGDGKLTMDAWKSAPISSNRLTTPAHPG